MSQEDSAKMRVWINKAHSQVQTLLELETSISVPEWAGIEGPDPSFSGAPGPMRRQVGGGPKLRQWRPLRSIGALRPLMEG